MYLCCQQQNGNVGGLTARLELEQCRGPVHLRHHDVQKDRIRLLFAGAFDPLLAGVGENNVPTRDRLQAHACNLAYVVFVVDD